jgi:threonine dehydrogenase-like Zn-dependent dehydrogenase
MKSKAAIQVEVAGPLVIEEIDIPDPGPNQVTVRNFASGVCYSQVHQLRNPGYANSGSRTSRYRIEPERSDGGHRCSHGAADDRDGLADTAAHHHP